MGSEFFLRTEEIKNDEVLDLMVESRNERSILDLLKGREPIILRGSRGVGKSFLFYAAEAELKNDMDSRAILPVYVAFHQVGLVQGVSGDQFVPWMVARICDGIVRAAERSGRQVPAASAINHLTGSDSRGRPVPMQALIDAFESARRKKRGQRISAPDLESVKSAARDLCEALAFDRINLFIDEAAHVFIPEQQRQFFALMRDLRSPYLSVKAAVYPGATTYGPAFQIGHDGKLVDLERSVRDRDYIGYMRKIVEKQNKSLLPSLDANPLIFQTLAYAATGNPRILLKTLGIRPIKKTTALAAMKKQYREEIWSEHSALAERYRGHRALIDWGRQFMEEIALPALGASNRRLKEQHAHIWVHRDAPSAAHQALQLLCYSGVLQEAASGVRIGTKGVGTRYMVNIGCQIATEDDPEAYCQHLMGALGTASLPELELVANDSRLDEMREFDPKALEYEGNAAFVRRLKAPSERLEVSGFLQSKFRELGLSTIGDVLGADESLLRTAKQVGVKRAALMRSAAVAAVMEYLSG